MRCLEKGFNNTQYQRYRDAMPDLVDRFGWYCAYCEMKIANEPDVEHVQPKTRGGTNDWENLLLACKKCNKIKGNKNTDRQDHLWPDEDNTIVAYEYYNEIFVRPRAELANTPAAMFASNTLSLTGIDRVPGNGTVADKDLGRDSRWKERRTAWLMAQRTANNWRAQPTPEMVVTIADLAEQTGFYSIWMQFFAAPEFEEVLVEIELRFRNTYTPIADTSGGWVLRKATARF